MDPKVISWKINCFFHLNLFGSRIHRYFNFSVHNHTIFSDCDVSKQTIIDIPSLFLHDE